MGVSLRHAQDAGKNHHDPNEAGGWLADSGPGRTLGTTEGPNGDHGPG